MINLTITVENVKEVLKLFDTVELLKYNKEGAPPLPIDLTDYATISGIDHMSDRTNVSDVKLLSSYEEYYFTDPNGHDTSWYISRYLNTTTSGSSAWSDPVQGDPGDLYYNPIYPPEKTFSAADQIVIDRIRILIGDPIGLHREFGPEAEASIHPDGRVYEMIETGWPSSVNMYGKQYTKKNDPSVNGYRYLKFQEAIDTTITTVSGVQYSVDLWYYTFRFSDRHIMEAYDHCPPPPPLNMTNCTQEIFILQTSYDLLSSESWEHINEDGALIKDEGSTYDPSAGLRARADMLSKLRKRLDDAIKANRLLGIVGVRVD